MLLRALKFFSTSTTGSAADAAAPVAISPSPRCHGAWEFGSLALAAAVPCGEINCRSPQGGDGSPGWGDKILSRSVQ